ncbi:MAG: aminodeoxychorismate synthase, component I [Candidatus Marinimicrobia bacterium]|nr:aminodeoxychorismate synthase, component I [Candidatus Neomarinimicrobiota bacterium]
MKPITFCDPLAAFAPLVDQDLAIILDSALEGECGRFSYIALDPFRVIRCTPYPWSVTIDGRYIHDRPFTALAQELERYKVERTKEVPVPFLGGAIGFFSYELGGVLESLPRPKSAPFPWDMVVGFYDVITAFDLKYRKAWVISSGFPETVPALRQTRAEARAQQMVSMLGSQPIKPIRQITPASWQHESDQNSYEARVTTAIDATYAGEIYQANISQRFIADIPSSTTSFEIYRRLRKTSPAPFAAFINTSDGMNILSASPERFLQVDSGRRVESRPIKGTRARGLTPEQDHSLADDLLNSTKDRAENLMIVDLLRNDLSRVCQLGSISVPDLCSLETYPSVHHLVSVVTGILQQDKTAVDLLRATFPGGSITGAPKIKAMEIIHKLEVAARGPYCGTIAWLGFDGAMDSSIVIRTIVVNGQKAIVQTGGGIVADSNPTSEYSESLVKAQPLLETLKSSKML